MDWFDTYIENSKSVLIIAEAGINHNGNFKLALDLINEAKNAGADCIKFQTFSYEASESKHSTMPGYFDGRIGFETKKQWYDSIYFSEEQFTELKNACEEADIAFLSTACDISGLHVLNRIGVGAIKIASADVNNDYLLRAVGKLELPVILSTGMSDLKELDHGINVLERNGCKKIALTQCTSEYPTPYSQINLKVMQTLADRYHVPIGLSDHSQGIEVAIAAAAMGARIIEKHFTLDRSLPGVDHAASIEPSELAALVKAVRHVEQAIGDGVKSVQDAERENALSMRRSLMAARKVKAGSILTEADITAKRPGFGVPPCEIEQFIGRQVNVDLEPEDLLDFAMVTPEGD